MALVVYPAEGYDSFVSLLDADTYAASHGIADWSARPDADKEAALRVATQFIFGRRLTDEALYDTSTDPWTARVHTKVGQATIEAAARQARGQLYRDVDPTPVTEKTVGPLTLKYGPQENMGQKRFAIIDDLLFGLVFTGPQGFGPVVFERA